MRKILSILLLMGLIAPSGKAESDENVFGMTLDELMQVVVTPSRKAESIDDAPNVMYVFSREMIMKRGFHSIKDILEIIPGVGVFRHPISYPMQVRGFSSNTDNHFNYLINGHRLNNSDESMAYTWPVNLDNIERVEVIVGPSSVLYGPSSLFMTVNLITRELDGAEVTGSAGTNEDNRDTSYTASIMYGTNLYPDVRLDLSATVSRSGGYSSRDFYRHSASPHATGIDMRDKQLEYQYPSYFLTANLVMGEWSLMFFSKNQENTEEFQNSFANDVDARRDEYMDSIVLRRERPVTAELSPFFELSYDNERTIRGMRSGAKGIVQDLHVKRYNADYSMRRMTARQYLQFGIQGTASFNRHNYELTLDPSGDQINDSGTAKSHVLPSENYIVGGYVSLEEQVHERVKLTGALRGDVSSFTEKEELLLAPRAAAIIKVTQNWTLKPMVNVAHKMPSAYESHLQQIYNSDRGAPPSLASPNAPARNAERLTSYELQSIYYLGRTRIAANVYHQQVDDAIYWVRGMGNGADYDGRGLELDIAWPVNETLSVWMNGSYQDMNVDEFDETDGDDRGGQASPEGKLKGIPAYMVNLGAVWQVNRSFSVAPTARFFTQQPVRMYTPPDRLIGDPDEWATYLDGPDGWQDIRVDNIWYLDLSLYHKDFLVPDFDLRLAAKNLLDNRDRIGLQYADGTMEPRGRYIELKGVYRF